MRGLCWVLLLLGAPSGGLATPAGRVPGAAGATAPNPASGAAGTGAATAAAPRAAAAGGATAAAPRAAAAGDSATPHPSGTEPDYPEDRPFVGDPGGEPPPPPVRPRPPEPRRPPPRPAVPARPRPTAPPTADKPEDLLVPPGPNLLTGQVGLHAGLTRHAVGGFRLDLGWSYQMTRHLWFDFLGDVTFGGACRVVATDPQGRTLDSDCGAFRGIGVDLLAGVQWKFLSTQLWRAPVVPFVRAAAGVAFLITDTPNDGAALVFRVGGGARYYFSPRFSVGGELAFTLGPAWRNHLPGGFYAALAVLAGVEFLI